MKRVLVTGGAGFIGSNTVDLLLGRGYDVSVVDDLSTGRRGNLNPGSSFHRCDITSKALDGVFRRERPDAVVHLAAQINVRMSIEEPGFDAMVNVLGTLNVLESARRHGVSKVVYSSSGGAVYGEPKYNPVDEDHPVKPICPYGASKYAGEKILEVYGGLHGLDYNIVRYGNVYGPRQDPRGEAGVAAIFTGLLLKGKRPTIFGDGRQSRDFCFVGDVAEANLAALKRKGRSRVYNIGSGEETSVNELTARLTAAVGADLKPKHGPAVAGEVKRIFLDVSRARRELRWKPMTGLDEGLDATVGWVRDA